jgi:transcriptional regulator with XRE-family HTH domain
VGIMRLSAEVDGGQPSRKSGAAPPAVGMQLRRLREAAGITIDQVAEKLECSASKISRIETGQTGVTPRDVHRLIAVYGVPEDSADLLLRFAREARQKEGGW